jgi:hypothetical protein
MSCGLDGYVIDIEDEAETTSAARPVEALVRGLRETVSQKPLGYTSFGACQFHQQMPWRVLNRGTDFFLPQIYFEQWNFAPTEDEVQQCLAAARALPLIKEVLPIWGSEGGAEFPATADELQSFLNRYPGSSIFRVPQDNEKGQACNLEYGAHARPAIKEVAERLRESAYVMRPGSNSLSVYHLKQLLSAIGYSSSEANEIYDASLEEAVRRFQQAANIAVDGTAGPETISALTGALPFPHAEQGIREHLAYLAQTKVIFSSHGMVHTPPQKNIFLPYDRKWCNATSSHPPTPFTIGVGPMSVGAVGRLATVFQMRPDPLARHLRWFQSGQPGLSKMDIGSIKAPKVPEETSFYSTGMVTVPNIAT